LAKTAFGGSEMRPACRTACCAAGRQPHDLRSPILLSHPLPPCPPTPAGAAAHHLGIDELAAGVGLQRLHHCVQNVLDASHLQQQQAVAEPASRPLALRRKRKEEGGGLPQPSSCGSTTTSLPPTCPRPPHMLACLDGVVGPIQVLVHSLKPARVIMGVAHDVHVELGRVAGGGAGDVSRRRRHRHCPRHCQQQSQGCLDQQGPRHVCHTPEPVCQRVFLSDRQLGDW
jgi:hypothetical protein